jgi:tetratricopeptide (TPR) repeat protein
MRLRSTLLALVFSACLPTLGLAGLTSDPQTLFDQAFQAGDLAQAKKALAAWSITGSANPEFWAARGLWWHASAHREEDETVFFQDAKRAMDDLQKAVAVLPTRLDLRLEVLELHFDLGEDESLVAEATRLGVSPEGGWTWRRGAPFPSEPNILIPTRFEDLAWELVRDGEKPSLQLALRLATVSEKCFPSHPGAYRVRGRIELDQEHFQEARRDLARAVDRDSNDSETLLDLGQALWELEQDEDSHRAFNRVLALNNDPDAVHRAKLALQKMEENP